MSVFLVRTQPVKARDPASEAMDTGFAVALKTAFSLNEHGLFYTLPEDFLVALAVMGPKLQFFVDSQ